MTERVKERCAIITYVSVGVALILSQRDIW